MGGCGTHSYQNISREKIDLALKALTKSNSTITGKNPWTVDTRYFGVKLAANWNQNTQTLNLSITDSDGTIPCPIIWKYLDNIVAKYK